MPLEMFLEVCFMFEAARATRAGKLGLDAALEPAMLPQRTAQFVSFAARNTNVHGRFNRQWICKRHTRPIMTGLSRNEFEVDDKKIP